MIAYQIIDSGQFGVTIADSEGKEFTSCDADELIQFLGRNTDGFKVAWDIDALMKPIIALLPESVAKSLSNGDKVRTPADHLLIYNQSKSLFIGLKHGASSSIYHISQYYPGESEPLTLKYVVVKTQDILKELAKIKVKPSKLSSPIAMFDGVFEGLDLPTWGDYPDQINLVASECLDQIWNTAYKMGYFPETFDYDISAAYPSVMARLIDTRKGDWVKSSNSKAFPKTAAYGFARGILRVSSELSPFVHLSRSGDSFDAKGPREKTIQLSDLKFLRDYDCGDFYISQGYWFIPDGAPIFPLEIIMKQYFRERADAAPVLKLILKCASNGIYGRFRQVFQPENKLGKQANLVWAAIIEGESRLKVGRFIFDNQIQEDVIQVATDGVLSTSEVKMNGNHDIGQWRLDSTGPALSVQTGLVFHGDKRPNAINLTEAIELINAKPKARNWSTYDSRGFRMLEANELDRKYDTLPQNGAELLSNQYSSKSFSVSEVK